MDAKEKCPFVKREPLYMGRWGIRAIQNLTLNLLYCTNSINKYCVKKN